MKNPHSSSYQALKQRILNNKTFFIAGHKRPDGDSVAAQLVLASILKRFHKSYRIYSSDPIPSNLLFLPGVNQIQLRKRVLRSFDVALIVECSGQDRMGNIIDLKKQALHIINIDHHAHYSIFGDVNLIDPKASSSCEQIHHLFNVLSLKITPDDALCLYTGIATDTGYFRHTNTSRTAHRLAAEYVALGVAPQKVYQLIYQQKTVRDISLLGSILSRIKLFYKGSVAILQIPQGYRETEEIINYGMLIGSVNIAILFQMLSLQKVRVSFRSRNAIDVGKIAVSLGGGGHVNAAGCTLNGTMASVQKQVLHLVRKFSA
jgi:phosphoesterase RecJ-like protein